MLTKMIHKYTTNMDVVYNLLVGTKIWLGRKINLDLLVIKYNGGGYSADSFLLLFELRNRAFRSMIYKFFIYKMGHTSLR